MYGQRRSEREIREIETMGLQPRNITTKKVFSCK